MCSMAQCHLTIEWLRQSPCPNLDTPWLLLTSFHLKYPWKSFLKYDSPSHLILNLATVGVRYLIHELRFEFALTIENLRQSACPNLVDPWLPLTSCKSKYPWKYIPTINTGGRSWPSNFEYMVRLTKWAKRLDRYTWNWTHLKNHFLTAECVQFNNNYFSKCAEFHVVKFIF